MPAQIRHLLYPKGVRKSPSKPSVPVVLAVLHEQKMKLAVVAAVLILELPYR